MVKSTGREQEQEPAPGCCSPRALWGWSPPALAAETPLQRGVDRVLPSTGLPLVVFFAAVVALLSVAPHLPERGNLVLDGLASLAAGGWCALNFWRCRHAHCLVTGIGWLALALFIFSEAGLGHSLISGYEQPVFLGVLVAGVAFEGAWYLVRGTHAVR